MKKFIAFTVAEVIIVMGIIGILSEMTIPTLIKSTQKSQGITGLQKSISIWDQALNTLEIQAGSYGDLSGVFDSSTAALS